MPGVIPPATSADFYLQSLTGQAFLEEQWPLVTRAVKSLRPFFESRFIDGTDWDAKLKGLAFSGDEDTRYQWRLFSDSASFYLQRNTGTQVNPSWSTVWHADQTGILAGAQISFREDDQFFFSDELNVSTENFYFTKNSGSAVLNFRDEISVSDANPAIKFRSDPDTGIRRSADNRLTVVAGGADVVDISNTEFQVNRPFDAQQPVTAQQSVTVRGPLTATGHATFQGGVTGFYLPNLEDVSSTSPTESDVLTFVSGQWIPQAVTSVKVAETFTASVEWEMTHDLGTSDLLWATYDDASRALLPAVVDVSDPNTAFFYFAEAVAGRAVVRS